MVLPMIVGLFVDGLAALLIFVPVFMPLVPAFGLVFFPGIVTFLPNLIFGPG